MRVLLTNDDGIDAPGIQVLHQSVQDFGQQRGLAQTLRTFRVAPQTEQSGCGHRLSTYQPIHVDHRDEVSFAVAGTPADCVRLGLATFVKTIDWVLSGINAGSNLGADIYTSGTVAAVREAALHRIPAIAFSLHTTPGIPEDWGRAQQWATKILHLLTEQPSQPGSYWNVNFPTLPPAAPDPEIVFVPVCTQPLPLSFLQAQDCYHYTGRYPDRQRDPGSDTEACMGHKQISITRLSL